MVWRWAKKLPDALKMVKKLGIAQEAVEGLLQTISGVHKESTTMEKEMYETYQTVAELFNRWEIKVQGKEVILAGGLRPSDPDLDFAERIRQLKRRCKAAGVPISFGDSNSEAEYD